MTRQPSDRRPHEQLERDERRDRVAGQAEQQHRRAPPPRSVPARRTSRTRTACPAGRRPATGSRGRPRRTPGRTTSYGPTDTPPETMTTSASRRRAAACATTSSSRSSAMPEVDRLGAGSRARAPGGPGRSHRGCPAGPRSVAGLADLVTRREHGDARAAPHGDLPAAGPGGERDHGRRHELAAAGDHGARGDVAARPTDRIPGPDRLVDEARRRQRPDGVAAARTRMPAASTGVVELHGDDGVRAAAAPMRTGRDPHGRLRPGPARRGASPARTSPTTVSRTGRALGRHGDVRATGSRSRPSPSCPMAGARSPRPPARRAPGRAPARAPRASSSSSGSTPARTVAWAASIAQQSRSPRVADPRGRAVAGGHAVADDRAEAPRVSIPARRPSSATARPSRPPWLISIQGTPQRSRSGARTGACGGVGHDVSHAGRRESAPPEALEAPDPQDAHDPVLVHDGKGADAVLALEAVRRTCRW